MARFEDIDTTAYHAAHDCEPAGHGWWWFENLDCGGIWNAYEMKTYMDAVEELPDGKWRLLV